MAAFYDALMSQAEALFGIEAALWSLVAVQSLLICIDLVRLVRKK